jgi:hypothetical protein
MTLAGANAVYHVEKLGPQGKIEALRLELDGLPALVGASRLVAYASGRFSALEDVNGSGRSGN